MTATRRMCFQQRKCDHVVGHSQQHQHTPSISTPLIRYPMIVMLQGHRLVLVYFLLIILLIEHFQSTNSDGSLHNLETHILTQLEQVWRDMIEPSSPSFCEESLRIALAQSASMRQIFYIDGEHEILDEENIQQVAHAQHTFITDAIGQLLADEPHTVIDACVEVSKNIIAVEYL
jgi:hypothetical protein